jgi:pimeloyl-ACP methyl ester carboxylesterase
MTKTICDQNVKNCANLVVNNVKNYGPSNCCYRLWGPSVPTKGKPNTVLVHGAPSIRLEGEKCVMPAAGHILKRPNNYFCNLDTLLQNELYGSHNIWKFEYADEPVEDPITHETLYFNFGDLANYGTRLRQAIEVVKTCNPGVNVNIIAHSMGGLVARYAAQDGIVNKIVTLDTGHLGFNLAGFFAAMLRNFPKEIWEGVLCVEQTAPGSDFLNKLNGDFTRCKVRVLSLAAFDPLPVVGRIVELKSACLGNVSPNGDIPYNDQCTPCDIVYHVNHLSIIQIYSEYHPAFCKIAEFLGHKC